MLSFGKSASPSIYGALFSEENKFNWNFPQFQIPLFLYQAVTS
jgi:hypothetical protein